MEEKKVDFKRIIKGAGISILITIVSITIFSCILTYTRLQENTIPVFTIIITFISILIGSVFSTNNVKKNGMVTGLAIGFIYIFSIYIISSIVLKNFSLNTYSLIMIIASLFSGAIGGIIGVNIK